MPLYEVKCSACKIQAERLCKMSERNNQKCKACGSTMELMVSMPAKTPNLWNNGWTDGLSGYAKYDNGLGMDIYSESHRDKELKRRGWIREEELGSDWWDTNLSTRKEKALKEQQFDDDYAAALVKHDGDSAKALVEALPAHQILNGDD